METVRSSKRVVKPNNKYINENFTTQQRNKPANCAKNVLLKLANKKKTPTGKVVNVAAKKAPNKTSLPPKTPLPSKSAGPAAACPKKVPPKKSKYRIDFTNVADTISISDCRNFLLEHVKANDSGRQVSIKERKLQIIVKCETFIKKETIRIAVKKFLKSLGIVHLTKVTAISKSGYAISKK